MTGGYFEYQLPLNPLSAALDLHAVLFDLGCCIAGSAIPRVLVSDDQRARKPCAMGIAFHIPSAVLQVYRATVEALGHI